MWGCAICEQEFYTKREMEKHTYQYHIGDNATDRTIKLLKKPKATTDSKCGKCDMDFPIPTELERHMIRVHGDGHGEEKENEEVDRIETEKFFCSVCRLKFLTQLLLEMHMEGCRMRQGTTLMLVEEGNKVGQGCYLCVSCEMEFNSLGEQEDHMAMHRGLRGRVEEAEARHTMESEEMTLSVESLLRENEILKKKLQESNWTISKLKTMLKQSRLLVRELEADSYRKETFDDFETVETNKVVVKEEFNETNVPIEDNVQCMVSQMDLFLKQINQKQVLNNPQAQGEVLLAEDKKGYESLADNTLPTMDTLNTKNPKRKKISNELVYGSLANESPKGLQKESIPLIEAIQKQRRKFNCKTCEKVFISKAYLKRHQLKHALPGSKYFLYGKQEKGKCFSAFVRLSKLKSKSPTIGIEDELQKNSEGKYECNYCNHKHFSKKRVKYHIMSQHLSNDRKAQCFDENKTGAGKVDNIHLKPKKSQSSSSKRVEDKFQCPHCIFHSSYKSNMKTHIKNQHEEQKFKHLEVENRLHDVLKKYLE